MQFNSGLFRTEKPEPLSDQLGECILLPVRVRLTARAGPTLGGHGNEANAKRSVPPGFVQHGSGVQLPLLCFNGAALGLGAGEAAFCWT